MRKIRNENESPERREDCSQQERRTERTPFAPPILTKHEELPLITAGSLDLGMDDVD